MCCSPAWPTRSLTSQEWSAWQTWSRKLLVPGIAARKNKLYSSNNGLISLGEKVITKNFQSWTHRLLEIFVSSSPSFLHLTNLIVIQHHYFQQTIANEAVRLQPGDPVLPQVYGHEADEVLQHPRTNKLYLVRTQREVTQLGETNKYLKTISGWVKPS